MGFGVRRQQGLGFGCAQALVREGVNVVINARNADVLARAAAKLIAASAEYASARGQRLTTCRRGRSC